MSSRLRRQRREVRLGVHEVRGVDAELASPAVSRCVREETREVSARDRTERRSANGTGSRRALVESARKKVQDRRARWKICFFSKKKHDDVSSRSCPTTGAENEELDEIVRPGPSLARVGETGGSRARRAGRFRRVGNRRRALGRAAGAIAKKHAPFGAVALRIFCAPRVTRAALVPRRGARRGGIARAERDATSHRARPLDTDAAGVRPARTGARARTDPLETRTPRAVPFGIGVVTRHAPSVEVSITSSSLLLLKRGDWSPGVLLDGAERCAVAGGGAFGFRCDRRDRAEKRKALPDVEAAEPGRFLPEVRTTRAKRRLV